ncbi:hypothetical protein DS742_13965 [Lacrimispora amygdalina]|uniref:DUF3168 domain-containing protein n=1 Tax=Lacrimispora amygdalina TaxID=253257 RepID=A0A3E2NBG1_9FIRM|nr:hypothetical protein DS742_13965 [Clostridium indicum]
MDQICRSEELIKLLGEAEEEYPEDIIPYKWSFPHEYIPETITQTDKFINFEISAAIDPRNDVYKDLTIYFYIICHQDAIRYEENGRTYLWYDKAVCELDNIFSDKNILGIGTTTLVSNVPYYPQQKFKGRLLKFVVKDFSDGAKYGR